MRVHTLDLHFQDTPGLIAAYLLESEAGLVLVETGPGSTSSALREGIRSLGFAERDVRHVLVTHIHLDHAGGAGWWAGQGARLYCHPNAARHLVDPTRLFESARRVYGNAMDQLWGQMLPAPADRVRALEDGEVLRLGDLEITAWDTPGHARHHHAYICGDVCFTGDAAGVRLEGQDYLSVTSAPPQFEPAAYVATVDRLLAGDFRALYLAHYGEITDVNAHLMAYKRRIQEVDERMRLWVKAGHDAEATRRLYHDAEHALATMSQGVSPSSWLNYEKANGTSMCADGVRLWVEKAT